MKIPKVSVVIPTYNRIKFLGRTIDSVLNQSFTDYELIICDDHSSDETEKYCRRIAKTNRKIRYIRNRKNLGLVGNWNLGLSQVKGKYATFLMDDDYWKTEFLAQTYKVLSRDNQIGFVVVWIKPVFIDDYGLINSIKEKEKIYQLHLINRKILGVNGLAKYLQHDLLIGLPSGILFRVDRRFKFDDQGLDPGFWLDYCHNYKYYYYLNKPLCFKGDHGGGQFLEQQLLNKSCRRMIYNFNKAYNYLLLQNKTNQKIENVYYKHLSDYFRILGVGIN